MKNYMDKIQALYNDEIDDGTTIFLKDGTRIRFYCVEYAIRFINSQIDDTGNLMSKSIPDGICQCEGCLRRFL